MKRRPALVPLSRDHHQVLVMAQRLRRAGPDDCADAARNYLEHWDAEARLHLRLEERELFPLVERTIPEPALTSLGESLRDHAP
jgi:hemerythrin-like domain-containing protein